MICCMEIFCWVSCWPCGWKKNSWPPVDIEVWRWQSPLSGSHSGILQEKGCLFWCDQLLFVSLSLLYSTDAVGHKGRYNQSVSFFKEACTLTSEKTGVQEEMCRRMCWVEEFGSKLLQQVEVWMAVSQEMALPVSGQFSVWGRLSFIWAEICFPWSQLCPQGHVE